MNKNIFEFFKEYIINNSETDENLQKLLKNNVNYYIDEYDNIIFISEVLEDSYKNEITKILKHNVIRTNVNAEDIDLYKHISQIDEKTFYFEYDPYHNCIVNLEEVFEKIISIKTYCNSDGFCFEDDIEIIDFL